MSLIDKKELIGYFGEPIKSVVSYNNDAKAQGKIYNSLAFCFESLDCSKTFSNGMRMMQTIDLRYRTNISEAIYIIEHCIEGTEEQTRLYNELVQIHINNLEYEKANPPIPRVLGKKQKVSREPKERKEKVPKEPKVKVEKPQLKFSFKLSL